MSLRSKDAACEIPDTELEEFARGNLHGKARRAVLEHQLRGCPSCRSRLEMIRAEAEDEFLDEAEESAFEEALILKLSALAARSEREQKEARELVGAFIRQPIDRQWTLIRNSARYATLAFANRLLDAAYEANLDDPRHALEQTRMALEIADSLDPKFYTERVINDLKARATAHIGNAERTLGDLRRAAVSLQLAEELRAEGSLDPLLEAEIQLLESSLLRGQRKFDAALRRVRQAREVYEELGEPHWYCWGLIAEGNILELMDRQDEVLRCLDRADQVCDPGSMPRHALAIRNNRARALMNSGRAHEALQSLDNFREEYARVGDRTSMLRLTWLEANLYERIGRPDEAASKFEETIQGFAEAGLPYEVGNASLEYAQMLADAGRHAEVAKLSAATLELFRGLGVERETIAAWILFHQSASAGAVTASLIEKIADYFRRARLDRTST